MTNNAIDYLDVEAIVDYIGLQYMDEKNVYMMRLLGCAHPKLNHWNSDRFSGDTHRLILQVPREMFPPDSDNRREIEQDIYERGRQAMIAFESDDLHDVVIVPKLQRDNRWRGGIEQPLFVPAEATERLWRPGFFRLFLSHKSEQKAELEALRPYLHHYGIDIFLAHVEIEPDQEWLDDICYGLQTCDSLVIFHGPGLRESAWCNQEIGWAMGRGIYYHSILCGESPFGLHAAKQGSPADLSTPWSVAQAVATRLHQQDRLQEKLYDGFAARFASTTNGRDTWYTWERFEHLANCPVTHIARIIAAFEGNPEAMQSTHAVPAMERWKQRYLTDPPSASRAPQSGIEPMEEEYDPFEDE